VATLTMSGQETELASSREISIIDGRVRILSTSQGPMGSATDTYVLDADSMLPESRSVEQGPATIEVDYGSDEVTGTISAGQKIPVSVELEAPAFGADAALEAAIQAMPLQAGLRTTVRAIEIGMQQRVRYHSVAVESAETVAVPAGEFDTWKVTVEPIDDEGGGQVLWVRKEAPRVLVKAETTLPTQMGAATVKSELRALD
ncbi:MAG TPA: hypothetical protein VJ883_04340, partial [Woeseiaceae bacterium]|nr:hypothetical protein [Woeseiaceae bacterium]